MKRKLLILLAIVAVLAVVIAAPVSAKKPLRGEMDLTFNSETPQCPGFTWVGTIDFDDDDRGPYGMAFVPTAEPKFVGQAFFFEGNHLIYDSPFTCPDQDPVLWGFDKGVQSNKNLKARSNGYVQGVNPDFFDESLVGRNVHWDGVTDATGAPVLEFEGTFRIN